MKNTIINFYKLFAANSQLSVDISDPDIDMALDHLSKFPYSIFQDYPAPWGKQKLIQFIKESLPEKPKSGDCFQVGTGLWGHIQYLGVEFMNFEHTEPRLQIILSIRPVKTSLDKLTVIA